MKAKKAKQVLSAVFAAAMMFSTLFGTSAMAEEIDGDTIYVDQEVFDVTLPTTASQKFYIDPQGLIAVGKGGAAANTGTVTGAFEMSAVNRSSIPVALSVSYKLVDSAESDGVTVVSSVSDSGAAIKAATDRQIAVSVSAVESTTDTVSSGDTYGGNVFKASESGVDITNASGNLSSEDVVYAGSTTAATAAYLMTAETYKVQLKAGKTAEDAYDSNAYEYVVDDTAHMASCVKFTIGGYCSEKADWSDYANGKKTLKLDVVFKFSKVSTDTGDYTDAKVDTGEVGGVAPSIATTEYTVDPERNTEVTVNLGSGMLGAKGIKSVTWNGQELINSDNDAKYEDGKVILDSTVGAYFNRKGLLPATITITFDMNDPSAEAVAVDITLK